MLAQVFATGRESGTNWSDGVGLNPNGGTDRAPVANCRMSGREM